MNNLEGYGVELYRSKQVRNTVLGLIESDFANKMSSAASHKDWPFYINFSICVQNNIEKCIYRRIQFSNTAIQIKTFYDLLFSFEPFSRQLHTVTNVTVYGTSSCIKVYALHIYVYKNTYFTAFTVSCTICTHIRTFKTNQLAN